jgi:hypothetical protein
MGSRAGLVVAAAVALGAPQGMAAEAKTWYVYCEGASAEGHWAVFSANFWPHPETEDYGHRVGDAAKAFFEKRHGVALDGCAGVNFRDDSLAEHSRQMTAQLHRRMGDRVYFFPLPREVLQEDAAPLSSVALTAAVDEVGAALANGAGSAANGEPVQQWRPFTAPH